MAKRNYDNARKHMTVAGVEAALKNPLGQLPCSMWLATTTCCRQSSQRLQACRAGRAAATPLPDESKANDRGFSIGRHQSHRDNTWEELPGEVKWTNCLWLTVVCRCIHAARELHTERSLQSLDRFPEAMTLIAKANDGPGLERMHTDWSCKVLSATL